MGLPSSTRLPCDKPSDDSTNQWMFPRTSLVMRAPTYHEISSTTRLLNGEALRASLILSRRCFSAFFPQLSSQQEINYVRTFVVFAVGSFPRRLCVSNALSTYTSAVCDVDHVAAENVTGAQF